MIDPKQMDFAQLEAEEHELDDDLSHMVGLKADVMRKIENEQVSLVELRNYIEELPAERSTTATDLQDADDLTREKERNITSWQTQIVNIGTHIETRRHRRRLVRQEITRRIQPELTKPLLSFARDFATAQSVMIDAAFEKITDFAKMNDTLQGQLRDGMESNKDVLAGQPHRIVQAFNIIRGHLTESQRVFRAVLDDTGDE